jgi:hypothetical protein
MKVGDQVSWVDARGDRRFGTISEIETDGRVYVASSQTNKRGRRVTRVVEVYFESNEIARLTVRGAP